jgi:MYXO-CTERM domain-containing protein
MAAAGRSAAGRWRAPDLGQVIPFLAAIDRDDANVVYLRLSGSSGGARYEGLGVTRDGGATFSAPVTIPGGTLTSFLARRDGAVLVAGTQAGATIAFRSSDSGATFAPWTLPLHPRGLGERDGVLYAAADNLVDGFALARSSDGESWSPLMRYQDIAGVRACLQPRCQSDCAARAAQQLFAPAICGDPPENPVPEGGTSAPGCGCASARSADGRPSILPPLLGLAVMLSLSRRRRLSSGP